MFGQNGGSLGLNRTEASLIVPTPVVNPFLPSIVTLSAGNGCSACVDTMDRYGFSGRIMLDNLVFRTVCQDIFQL